MNDIGKRAHILKHSHGRCVIGYFDKILHEGSLWTGHRAVLSFILHKSIFLLFVHNAKKLYDKYISTKNRLKYIDDDGSGVLPKILVKKSNKARYQKSYSNREFVLRNDYIKDRIMNRTSLGRKRKATGYDLITGSPYSDAEGSPHHRSCLHDAIINAAPRIG